MRRWIFMTVCLIGLLAVLAGLAGCGGDPAGRPTAQESGQSTVVVFTPHGQEMLDEYAGAFEAAHPGIKVVGRFVPTGQILSQLRIDRAAPTVDIWWGGTTAFFSQAAADDLLEPYRPTWAAASPEGTHDPADLWYGVFLEAAAIMFNKNIYAPGQVPETWEALLTPAWRGKIVIREPMDSGTMKTIFTGLIWKLGGATDPTSGYDYLRRLNAHTHAYLPNPQALYDRIARSPEGYLSLWNVTDIIYQARANGYPFGYRIPEGPFPVSVDPIAIVAGAPHPEPARLFYEFVTTKENCLAMARDHYRILARDDIAPEEKPDWMTEVRIDPLPVDRAAFDRLQLEWMDHWRESIRDPEK